VEAEILKALGGKLFFFLAPPRGKAFECQQFNRAFLLSFGGGGNVDEFVDKIAESGQLMGHKRND
jgi:hypothetical protein